MIHVSKANAVSAKLGSGYGVDGGESEDHYLGACFSSSVGAQSSSLAPSLVHATADAATTTVRSDTGPTNHGQLRRVGHGMQAGAWPDKEKHSCLAGQLVPAAPVEVDWALELPTPHRQPHGNFDWLQPRVGLRWKSGKSLNTLSWTWRQSPCPNGGGSRMAVEPPRRGARRNAPCPWAS
ncbi:hypothetical protein GGTG_11337 [Gaeumannomyces tritici R3-111a-1]|uniref:Uncharacterized protein n=1 Tax=Gaeumannomyces tritici (strain R3-111a-1) TaxID=644352 RepID=J3PCW8_GAET3|nr:hypothetical protein GGTG_11337 [Gaeumannomyces tritici R3-111a-1]EJT72090.1 hypothetical protein GGTG_11337 [Gaeumannomyces tritici R3-111a-1]